MRFYIKSFVLILLISSMSCESLVDGINDNPNELNLDEVDAKLFLTGAMLANTVAQAGHLNRISGMWSGQLEGFTSLYSNIDGYNISTVESIGTWSRIYIGVVPNTQHIRNLVPDDKLLVGISKVLEAHAIGTAASLFGDVPYSQINDSNIDDPTFDNQIDVFNAVIDLLDGAIEDLGDAPSRDLPEDIYFEGEADKWLEAAHTLKARYHLQLREYDEAFSAAQGGISTPDGSMKFTPRGEPTVVEGDKNLFWTILEGSRSGDIGTGDSYLVNLLDPDHSASRNNAKTDETARLAYYRIDESGGSANTGIIEQFEPQRLIAYSENLLILAETAVRTQSEGFETGLSYLNEVRAFLNDGGIINASFIDQPFKYEPYTAEDFASGGMENPDGIDPERALLREIIQERYVSGFGMYIPFNDGRRLRRTEPDIAVDFPLNVSSASIMPQRMPYSDDELASNSNAPQEPGIFVPTRVNQ